MIRDIFEINMIGMIIQGTKIKWFSSVYYFLLKYLISLLKYGMNSSRKRNG